MLKYNLMKVMDFRSPLLTLMEIMLATSIFLCKGMRSQRFKATHSYISHSRYMRKEAFHQFGCLTKPSAMRLIDRSLTSLYLINLSGVLVPPLDIGDCNCTYRCTCMCVSECVCVCMWNLGRECDCTSACRCMYMKPLLVLSTFPAGDASAASQLSEQDSATLIWRTLTLYSTCDHSILGRKVSTMHSGTKFCRKM